MPFDGLTATYLATEMKTLIGAKVDRVHQPHKDMIILQLRLQRENLKLLISANAVNARINLTNNQYKNPMQPPLFCMVMRKHLEGCKIKDILQSPMERSFCLVFSGTDELGRATEKLLYVEIMGKHSNIILTTSEGVILDGIKRYTHEVSRHRQILPGEDYIAPPEQEKKNLTLLTQENFALLLFEALSAKKLTNTLTEVFLGLSSQTAKELLARADLSEDLRGEEIGEYELIRLWQAWQQIHPHNEATPCLLKLNGIENDYFPYEPLFIEAEKVHFPSLSEAIDAYFAAKEERSKFTVIKAELIKVIHGYSDKAQKKLALQEADFITAEDASKYKIYGEIITANLWQLPERAEELTLDNFYDNNKITIPLDKEINVAANAQRYFKKYNKAKQTLHYLSTQIEETKRELSYLTEVDTSLELSENVDDLQEIRRELELGGYLKSKEPSKKKKDLLKSEPYLFISPEGFNIYVGKNNLQNDRLTMKFAQDEDIWLHTKDIPGSHVIIRSEGKEVPFETIIYAAELAANYSKARLGSQVPVDYTGVKNVKKPNGAKPGYVIYDKQKTVYVTPYIK